MRGFVGISHAQDTEEAIREATAGLKNAELIIMIAPLEKAEQEAELNNKK